MLERKFYRFAEAGDLIGDEESLRQAVIFGRIDVYAELDCEGGIFIPFHQGPVPESGENDVASWHKNKFVAEEDFAQYQLEGWFKLTPRSAAALARAWAGISEINVGPDLAGAGGISVDRKPPKRFLLEEMFIDASAITPTASDAPAQGKALGTRERNNLLRIISALAKEAGIDISQGTGAADVIDAALQASEFDGPKARTIRDILKQVREVD